jgi:hypothetical protein
MIQDYLVFDLNIPPELTHSVDSEVLHCGAEPASIGIGLNHGHPSVDAAS